ncbi:hypothetical protein LUZ60_010275 [Juncus effusus]|nr:hypothetical protein LUZ60_010275 [Juncus effusus]
MAKILFVSALILASCLLTSAVSVSYCKKNVKYPVSVSSVDIDPNPVVGGKPATFNISASTEESYSEGSLVIDVKYFFFHVYQETDNICDKTSCPINGDFVLTHKQTLPSLTPPGSYTIQMTMKDSDNNVLTCISFDFSIGFLAEI